MPELPPPLPDRFEFERTLGQGGFGRVLLARERGGSRLVAIKLLDPGQEDPTFVDRFHREGRLTESLVHPHIVRTEERGLAADGSPYIVYEYLDGRDLARLVQQGERPTPERIREIGRAIASALALAHSRGVIHRDLKPENVMLTASGRAVLCDFGLARVLGGRTVVTQEGILLGTPAYIAPELWLGGEPTERSDQFAWGAVLFRLLTGEGLYPSDDPNRIVEFLRSGREFPAPTGLGAEASALLRVLARAIAVDPAHRYPDMAAFEAALAAPPEAPPERTQLVPSSRLARPPAAGPHPAPVTAPAPGRSPALAAGLAALALALGWLAATPAARDPGAKVPDGPLAATEAAAEAARADLLTFLEGAPALPEYRPEHTSEIAERLVDPRFELKLDRYLRGLVEWLEARLPAGAPAPGAPPAGFGEPEARRLAEHRTVLEHVIGDLQTLQFRIENPLNLTHRLGTERAFAIVPAANQAWERTKAMLAAHVDRMAGLGDDPPSEVLRFQAHLAGVCRHPRVTGLAAALVRAVERHQDPAELMADALAWMALVAKFGVETRIPCADRAAALARIRAGLHRIDPRLPLPLKVEWAARLASHHYFGALACPAESEAGLAAAAFEELQPLEAILDTLPDPQVQAIERETGAIQAWSDRHSARVTPSLRPIAERALALWNRAKARRRAEPPEPVPPRPPRKPPASGR